MASTGKITVDVTANVELVVLTCLDESCIHNMLKVGHLACNLKHMTISRDGACLSRQEKAE